jgi:hypothetical protein
MQKFVDGNGDPSMTNRAELIGIESCSKVLTPATIKQLGTGPFCAFPNDYELEIYLGRAVQVDPIKPTLKAPGINPSKL